MVLFTRASKVVRMGLYGLMVRFSTFLDAPRRTLVPCLPATALYSAVCSQCYTRGLSWQADTLAELNALRNTVSHRTVDHTGEIKRVQLNPQSQQVC
jgi:hypothetical protein